MNLPFRKPAPVPVRIVVDRERIVRLIAEVDNCRIEVAKAIALMKIGRTTAALETLEAIGRRLS